MMRKMRKTTSAEEPETGMKSEWMMRLEMRSRKMNEKMLICLADEVEVAAGIAV